MKEKNTKRTVFLICMTALALVLALIIGIRTSKLYTRLNDNAVANMVTYTKRSATEVGEIRQAYANLCGAIEVNADWESDHSGILSSMNSIMDHYEIYYLSFIGADGTGFNFRDQKCTRDSLPLDRGKITDFTQPYESETYIGNSGRYEYMLQYPVFREGVFVGDFYIGQSASAQFDFLNDSNYDVYIVEKSTGKIISSADPMPLIGNSQGTVYSLTDGSDETSEATEAIDTIMGSGNTDTILTSGGDTSAVLCLSPVTGTGWYVCTKADLESINGGADDVLTVIYQLLAVCFGGILLGGGLYLNFSKQKAASQAKNNETLRELNAQLNTALDSATRASRAKSEFLSNMSHDIRTPLNAIVGMTTIAAQNTGNAAKEKECLDVIKSSSLHLLSLVNDVLDISKIESGRMELVNEDFALGGLIHNIVAMMQPMISAKDQHFHIQITGLRHELLKGDGAHLRQILINLLNNANKYTPQGGNIWFTLEELPDASGTRTLLRFIVRDDGIGIAEENQKKIFEPFTREEDTKINTIEGTGLGLTIVRSIIAAMQGTILLESAREKGSTFTVEIPFDLQADAAADNAYASLKGKHVLLCSGNADPAACPYDCAYLSRRGIDLQFCAASAACESSALPQGEAPPWDALFLLHAEAAVHIPTLVADARRCAPKGCIVLVDDEPWNPSADALEKAGTDAVLSGPLFPSDISRFFTQRLKARPAAESPKVQSVLAGKHIMVVEDNAINRLIAEELLKSRGALIETANNGREAVDAFTASQPGHFDFILMDIQMPVLNGYAATRQIRGSAHPDAAQIPIIAMTANTFVEDIHAAEAAGMNGHISKPIDLETIEAVLQRVLDN